MGAEARAATEPSGPSGPSHHPAVSGVCSLPSRRERNPARAPTRREPVGSPQRWQGQSCGSCPPDTWRGESPRLRDHTCSRQHRELPPVTPATAMRSADLQSQVAGRDRGHAPTWASRGVVTAAARQATEGRTQCPGPERKGAVSARYALARLTSGPGGAPGHPLESACVEGCATPEVAELPSLHSKVHGLTEQ